MNRDNTWDAAGTCLNTLQIFAALNAYSIFFKKHNVVPRIPLVNGALLLGLSFWFLISSNCAPSYTVPQIHLSIIVISSVPVNTCSFGGHSIT